jgi:hypothetical protein
LGLLNSIAKKWTLLNGMIHIYIKNNVITVKCNNPNAENTINREKRVENLNFLPFFYSENPLYSIAV